MPVKSTVWSGRDPSPNFLIAACDRRAPTKKEARKRSSATKFESPEAASAARLNETSGAAPLAVGADDVVCMCVCYVSMCVHAWVVMLRFGAGAGRDLLPLRVRASTKDFALLVCTL